MRLSERLVKQNEEIVKRNKIDLKEEEETMTYMSRKVQSPLNQKKSDFDDDDKSINIQKSIFDRTALFHIESEDK